MTVAVGLAVAACLLTAAWGHWLHRKEGWDHIRERCEHRWVYHSLYRQGRLWNRICSWCFKHETHWRDTPHPNWPPPGARIKRGDVEPDETYRAAQAELRRRLDDDQGGRRGPA